MSRLYILATPIGNLNDISLRALEVLRQVDTIFAEDTRVTAKLLSHFEIKTPLFAYSYQIDSPKNQRIFDLLKEGKDVALVTDAGTPGISDPGGKIIEKVLKELRGEVEIIPIPGPNAALAALSISGFPTDKFLFLGFPPHKKGRQKFFQEVADSKYTIVFYESPHRIIKTLEALAGHPDLKDRPLVIARELTKKFESIYRGMAEEILEKYRNELEKGELTIVVNTSLVNTAFSGHSPSSSEPVRSL